MNFHGIVYFVGFFLVPTYLVVRAGWKATIIAAPLMWICGVVIGGSQRSEGAAAIHRLVWLVLGLGVSVVYCLLVALARDGLIRLYRRRRGREGAYRKYY
jgi:hypothetical protein